MSVERKIKELLERVDAKTSLEEAGKMGADGVSKDATLKAANTGDSTNPKQGDSKDASFETREDDGNQGEKVSKGVKKNTIQMKGPVGAAPNFTTTADPTSVVNQPNSKGNVHREEVETDEEEVISEEELETEDNIESDTDDVEVVAESELDISSELNSIFGENLSEEFKQKATAIFEAAVIAKVNNEIDQITEALTQKFAEETELYKETIVEKVDSYLNYVVENWMEENQLAIENGLRTEIAEDFISGLKVLFKEHYIEVPEEKYDVISELQNAVDELQEKLNTQIETNVGLFNEGIDLKRKLIIDEMSKDLTDIEKNKLTKLLENVEFDSEELFEEKVSVIKESYFDKDITEETTRQAILSEETNLNGGYGDDSIVSSYARALSRTIKK
jgi:hypothetical protein